MYVVVELNNSNRTDEESVLIERVAQQYNTICHYIKPVKTNKKVGMFGASKWQQGEGVPPVLSYKPLGRMIKDNELADEAYSHSDNILIVDMDDGDKIRGFIGGVTNALDILEEFYNKPALSSYDQSKYVNVFNHFVQEGQDMPMSWIEIICVHPDNRKQQIATGLIEKFKEICFRRNKTKTLLLGLDIVGVGIGNGGSINSELKEKYESMGFDFSMPFNVRDGYLMFSGAQFAGQIIKQTIN